MFLFVQKSKISAMSLSKNKLIFTRQLKNWQAKKNNNFVAITIHQVGSKLI